MCNIISCQYVTLQLTNLCLVFTVVDSGHLLSERRLSSQRSTVCRSGTSLWWVIMWLWCHHFNFDEELAYEWYDIDHMSCTVPIRLELYVNFIDGSACEVICDLKSFFKWFWFEITFQPVICDFDLKSLLSQWFLILIWNQCSTDLSHHCLRVS